MTEKIKPEKKGTSTHQEKQKITGERTQATSKQNSNKKQKPFRNENQRQSYQKKELSTAAIILTVVIISIVTEESIIIFIKTIIDTITSIKLTEIKS